MVNVHESYQVAWRKMLLRSCNLRILHLLRIILSDAKFLFQRVPGCASIADLSLKIVFWTHKVAVGTHWYGKQRDPGPISPKLQMNHCHVNPYLAQDYRSIINWKYLLIILYTCLTVLMVYASLCFLFFQILWWRPRQFIWWSSCCFTLQKRLFKTK